jgi:hypothetical protein
MPINEHGILDFPENPTNNDLHVDENNVQWRFNGEDWAIFEPYYINDLPDVDTETTPPEIGNILYFDGSKWVVTTKDFSLNDLTDVSINNQVDGNFLIFDGTTWQNADPIENDISIATAGNFVGIPTFDDEYEVDLAGTHFASNGTTIDTTNNRINIISNGFYRYDFSCYATTDYEKTRFIMKIYDSGNILKKEFDTSFAYVGTEMINQFVQLTGFYNLAAGDYLKFYVMDVATAQNNPEPSSTTIYNIFISVIRESTDT